MAATTTRQQSGTQQCSADGQSGGSMLTNQRQQPDFREGVVARSIEHYTAQLPSDTFLWAALGSIGLSLALRVAGNKHDSVFVGQWAPTFLLLGLYNKIVKVAGSDQQHQGLTPSASTMATHAAGI